MTGSLAWSAPSSAVPPPMARVMSWRRAAAATLGAVSVVGAVLAASLSWSAGMSWADVLEGFVVTNTLMGLSFGLCGALIVWHRPRSAIGWLFVGDGLGHLVSAVAAPLSAVMRAQGAPVWSVRGVETVFAYAWPWSIALFLPLALLVFPDGRPASRRWRPVIAVVAATAPFFVVAQGASPGSPAPGLPDPYLTIAGYDRFGWLWTASEVRTTAALALGVAALVVRYRKADDAGRRQLLWLLLAALLVLVIVVPWSYVSGTPVAVLFGIPLIPIAVTVAIVRHQVLDIRLVLSRAVAWAGLSLLAITLYVLVTGLLADLAVEATGRAGISAVVVALSLAPALPRLQRGVDRVIYGDRREPSRVVSRVGAELAAGREPLDDVVGAIREALRLPFVAVSARGVVVAESGTAGALVVQLPLAYAGENVGTLDVSPRAGERELGGRDRQALGVVAVTVAVAVRAMDLTASLQTSRERIVVAREEERRRLRRDLHDGIGPALTGMSLAADAAGNLLDGDRAEARVLIQSLRRDTRTTLVELRRVVDALRPAALDELGLVPALQQHACLLTRRSDGAPLEVRVRAPQQMPRLPAAVEVAAYRIAVEALTNVVRHASASVACLTLTCDDLVVVEVIDDGSSTEPWAQGVGMQSMRDRATELGGALEAGPGPSGGTVRASLPVHPAVAADGSLPAVSQ
ncbi:histidine kinase [Knoellia locipacati]|uniref:sensor histidine kinase n=1 Tax=Knoellia locipacati TaxID=882824 RepID=UPI00384DE665